MAPTRLEEASITILNNVSQPQDTTTKKNVRGKTRGINTSRVLHKAKGALLKIECSDEVLRVVGPNASLFKNEIGIIVRDIIPLTLKRFKNFDEVNKLEIYGRLANKFVIDFKSSRLKLVIDKICQERYKQFRHKLHIYYKKLIESNEDPKSKRPEVVKNQQDWEWLCNHFSSDDYKKQSEANKHNRSKMHQVHKSGTKSMAEHEYDMHTDDQILGKITLYKRTYWNEKNGWASIVAEKNYEKMLEMKEEQEEKQLDEGLDPASIKIDEDQICKSVLGEKFGYIKLGGPLAPSGKRSSSSTGQQNLELQQQVEQLQEVVESQQKLLSETQQQLATQKMEYEKSMATFESNQRQMIEKIVVEYAQQHR